MEYRTFKDWVSNGRMVMKGEKSAAKTTDGECLFRKDQTKKLKSSWHDYYDYVDRYADVDYDDSFIWERV